MGKLTDQIMSEIREEYEESKKPKGTSYPPGERPPADPPKQRKKSERNLTFENVAKRHQKQIKEATTHFVSRDSNEQPLEALWYLSELNKQIIWSMFFIARAGGIRMMDEPGFPLPQEYELFDTDEHFDRKQPQDLVTEYDDKKSKRNY